MALGVSDLRRALENTELIKVSADKHKYLNTKFQKVSAKMYDYNCDVKLKIGKETFRAHRDVLSEASDYFGAMFGHNMRERDSDVIEFHEISPQGFRDMLEYFYHGHITVDPQNIDDVIEAARFFHIEWLIHACCDFLIRHLCLENYHNVLHLADKYFLGDLRYDIFRFVGQNFVMLAEQPKFMAMSHELFYQLLAEDFFIDATEHFIFMTALRWLEFEESRDEYKVPILELIRYPLFTGEQLQSIPHEVFCIPEIKSMVNEALDYLEHPSKQCLMTSEHTETRGGQDVVMLISAIEDAHLIQYKIPGHPGFFSEEVDTSFLESVFEFVSTAVLGNFVFVAGGYDRHTWCSSAVFYRYNPRNHSWAELASMKQGRVSFALCTAPKGLYAVAGIEHIVEGGHDTENYLNSVEYYDPTSGLWRFIPPLPSGCFSIAAACLGETLYVSGGITDDLEDTIPVSHVRAYTPGDVSWSNKAAMIVNRQGHAMHGLNGKLFVFGGYTTGDDTMSFNHCMDAEIYDQEIDQWTQLLGVSPEVGHIHSTSTHLDNNIYVVGGKHANRFLLTMDSESAEFDEEEFCGQYIQKVLAIRVSFPFDIEYVETAECSDEDEEEEESS